MNRYERAVVVGLIFVMILVGAMPIHAQQPGGNYQPADPLPFLDPIAYNHQIWSQLFLETFDEGADFWEITDGPVTIEALFNGNANGNPFLLDAVSVDYFSGAQLLANPDTPQWIKDAALYQSLSFSFIDGYLTTPNGQAFAQIIAISGDELGAGYTTYLHPFKESLLPAFPVSTLLGDTCTAATSCPGISTVGAGYCGEGFELDWPCYDDACDTYKMTTSTLCETRAGCRDSAWETFKKKKSACNREWVSCMVLPAAVAWWNPPAFLAASFGCLALRAYCVDIEGREDYNDTLKECDDNHDDAIAAATATFHDTLTGDCCVPTPDIEETEGGEDVQEEVAACASDADCGPDEVCFSLPFSPLGICLTPL